MDSLKLNFLAIAQSRSIMRWTLSVAAGEAWQVALQRTQKTANARRAYPADALKIVLQRYVAWQMSTSAVEQGFSKLERVCFPSPASAHQEQHLTRLRVANLQEAQEEAVLARARKLYLEVSPGDRARHGLYYLIAALVSLPCSGSLLSSSCICFGFSPSLPGRLGRRAISRSRKIARIDKNVVRPRGVEEGTEQGWLKKRRAAVDDSLHELASSDETHEEAAASELWTKGHEAELQKQRKKQTRHTVEALWDGRLLPEEITDDLKNAADALAASNKVQDKLLSQTYRRAARRQQMLDQTFDWQKMSGCKYWYHPRGHADLRLRRCMMEWNLQPVEERLEADVYIVPNAAEPGQRVQWMAVLGGRIILEEKFALQEASGLVVCYKAVLARGKHRLFLTQAFVDKHPIISDIFQSFMQRAGHPGMKTSWKLSARADADVVLGTSEEIESKARGERCFDKRSFLEKFSLLGCRFSAQESRIISYRHLLHHVFLLFRVNQMPNS